MLECLPTMWKGLGLILATHTHTCMHVHTRTHTHIHTRKARKNEESEHKHRHTHTPGKLGKMKRANTHTDTHAHTHTRKAKGNEENKWRKFIMLWITKQGRTLQYLLQKSPLQCEPKSRLGISNFLSLLSLFLHQNLGWSCALLDNWNRHPKEFEFWWSDVEN